MDDLFANTAVRAQQLSQEDVERLAALPAPAHLIDCDLDELDLSGVRLAGWTFDRCTLRRTNLTGATLEATIWRSCRGAFAVFVGADLGDATVTACDFNNAEFRRATMSAATFERCKLTGADLSEAKAFDIRFVETLLINAKLAQFSFRKQRLERLDFSQADLRNCDFRDADLDGCSLRDARLTGSKFADADLRGADLGGLKLVDATLFRGATISREQAGALLAELGLNVR